MQIFRALLKYGFPKFSLEILEYCEPSDLLIREKHYWDIFTPEYNIAQDPTAPFSGRKHSEGTKIIMSDAKQGENHPNYGKNLSNETKTKISDTKKGQKRPEGSGRVSQQIEVTDIKNNTINSYASMSEAARALNISQASISIYFKNNKQNPYKGQYTFKKL